MRSGAAWKPEGAHPSVNDVQRWWDQAACGTQFTEAEKFSEDYFEQIEKARYGLEPMILDFADFPGARDRDVLEVGVGAGTDFVNWVRHGARAHGVDLTLEAIEHTRRRLQMERLEPAALEQANAEALDFADASFDLVYSWGVIHHSPSSQRSLAEIVRVTRPGGTIKLMVYHRHSVAAFMVWLRRCALRGRPDRSLSYAMAHFVESPGTRAFTQQEVRHDQASFYWWPLSGGSIQSVSAGGFIIQNLPLPAPPYIYFDEFITDRLYRIAMSGVTPEEVDVFTLGGTRGLARDENNLYWIGARDGSFLKTMPVGGGARSTLLSGAAVFSPHKLKAVPNGSGGTTLFWLDTATNGNPVVRRFPVPGGPATSIFNDENMIDFTVTDEAIYWWTADYIGRWDLAAVSATFPVVITGGLAIQGVTVVGDYIYYSISDGWVYRVRR